jgi:sporulation-control protein
METEVYMQVDRKARGLGGFLSEAMSMDESHVHFKVHASELSSIREKIASVIQKYS